MIMIHQPVHPYQSAPGWVDYHQAIADAVPDLGVVLYIRDERVTGAQIADLGERCPNVIGVKYGVKDASQFAAVARDAGLDRFTWLAGLAEPYAPRVLGLRRPRVHLGTGQRQPGPVAVPAGGAAGRRPTGAMDVWEQIRPFEDLRAAGGVRGQRDRGQGGPGPAGPVRPGGTSAEPGLAGSRTGGGGRHPQVLEPVRRKCQWDRASGSDSALGAGTGAGAGRGRAREQDTRAAPQPRLVRQRADGRPAVLQPPLADAPARVSRAEEHLGKPIIAILNTWSEMNPCHMHLRERASQVKRGVLEAGGFPVEFPVATLSETFQKPTPMMYRNLLAMDTEELLRSYPADGAVLMGGCDKTTPALLMGAASAGIPAIYVPAGPMLRGNYRGQPVGSGTDMWKFWDDARAGLIGDCEMADLEGGIARSPGHCMTMGTASTHDVRRRSAGHDLARGRVDPGRRLGALPDGRGQRSADRADWCGMTCGPRTSSPGRRSRTRWPPCSPSAAPPTRVIHLIAMAGRAGVAAHPGRLRRDRPPRPGARQHPAQRHVPDGGLLLRRRPARAARPAATVPGALHLDRPHGHRRPRSASRSPTWPVYDEDVIRSPENALAAEGGVAVLRGNLAPDGAVIKHIAAEPRLLKHTGPAVVFDDYTEMQKRINDPALNVTADSVLVLRNAGPKGGPGMPEYGMLPIPDYLLEQGVRDMVRISDARMSGTSYGACVLHVAPEAFVGGPLALVRTGDAITLDAAARELRLEVPDAELARRRAQWPAPRAEVRARLRRAVHRADHPGQRRLRLRLPGPAGPEPGSERAVGRPAG